MEQSYNLTKSYAKLIKTKKRKIFLLNKQLSPTCNTL